MIESTITFIINVFSIFVKFLSDIEITLGGHTFTFWNFFLVSVIILSVVSVAVVSIKRVGSNRINSKSYKHDETSRNDSDSNSN